MVDERDCWLKTVVEGGTLTVLAGGAWTVHAAGRLNELVDGLRADGVDSARLDLSELTALDTAGAWILRRTVNSLDEDGVSSEVIGLDAEYAPLFDIVEEADEQPHEALW